MFNLAKMLLLAGLTVAPATAAMAQTFNPQPKPTTVMVGCQPVFDVASAGGDMSPAQRARIIQANIDAALIAQRDGSPKVLIKNVKGTPVVYINGQYIASADAATAAAMHLTPQALANSWANAISKELLNQVAGTSLGHSTGTISLAATLPPANVMQQQKAFRFARLPAGMMLPVALETDVHTAAMRPGDQVVALTLSDITLPGGEVLAHGTHLIASIQPTDTDNMFGVGKLKLSFDRMQLADGTDFPISASVLMNGQAVSDFVLMPGTDMAYPAGTQFVLRMNAPAQVAVNGNVL